MTFQTQVRLLGGIVIVAFAALLVPIFFDGEGLDAVPSVPGVRHGLGQDLMPVSEPIDSDQPEWDFVQEVENLRQQADTIKTSPGHLDAPGEVADRGDDKLMGRLSGTGFDDAGLPETWAVQLGVFANQNNALALQRRVDIRFVEAGHRAILDVIEQKGKTLYRVSVGPFLDRVKADDVLTILQQESIVHEPVIKKFSLLADKQNKQDKP